MCSGTKTRPGELRSIHPRHRDRIEAWVIQDVPTALDVLEDTEGFDMVVLDHATGLYDMAIRDILGLEQLPAQKTFGMATQQQWGAAVSQTKEVISKLFSVDAHAVVVCQEKLYNVQDFADVLKPKVGVSLSDKMAGWLLPASDYVMQTYKRPGVIERKVTIGEGKNAKVKVMTEEDHDHPAYALRIGPHSVFATKFRRPAEMNREGSEHPLPDFILDPTFEKFDELAKSIS